MLVSVKNFDSIKLLLSEMMLKDARYLVAERNQQVNYAVAANYQIVEDTAWLIRPNEENHLRLWNENRELTVKEINDVIRKMEVMKQSTVDVSQFIISTPNPKQPYLDYDNFEHCLFHLKLIEEYYVELYKSRMASIGKYDKQGVETSKQNISLAVHRMCTSDGARKVLDDWYRKNKGLGLYIPSTFKPFMEKSNPITLSHLINRLSITNKNPFAKNKFKKRF